jgi:phage portal protein BeeE
MPDSKTGLLSYYQYNPGLGASPKDLSPDDVVHFRFGFDPNNILRGFSPLAAVMREVYTDDQAANFTAAILKNLGIIGIVLSPKQGSIPKGDLPALKDDIQQKFTGDKRGSALIMGGPMDAQVLQYNLTGFDISPVRDIAEERVTAALGIPAAVIGFGTGLQQTKVGATMREMVKLAWQGGIEPNQRSIAAELNRSVLPEFQDNAKIFRSLFDNSQVEALTETPSERTDRVLKLVETNIIKVTQAQRELGYPVDESQNKYMRELQPTPVKPPTLPALPAEPGNRVGDNLPAEN